MSTTKPSPNESAIFILSIGALATLHGDFPVAILLLIASAVMVDRCPIFGHTPIKVLGGYHGHMECKKCEKYLGPADDDMPYEFEKSV